MTNAKIFDRQTECFGLVSDHRNTSRKRNICTTNPIIKMQTCTEMSRNFFFENKATKIKTLYVYRHTLCSVSRSIETVILIGQWVQFGEEAEPRHLSATSITFAFLGITFSFLCFRHLIGRRNALTRQQVIEIDVTLYKFGRHEVSSQKIGRFAPV